MHLLIPNLHSIPSHPSPLGSHQSFFCLWVSSCLWTTHETETGVSKGGLLFSHSVISDSLWPRGLQHARVPCLLPSPTAWWNSWPLSQWCHPTISSSVVLFSSCLQSFPASGSFPMSQFLASGGQSIGASASALVLSMNMTGLSSLQSKGLSRVFYKTTVQKHQFFGAQPSLQSNSYIHIWLLEKP